MKNIFYLRIAGFKIKIVFSNKSDNVTDQYNLDLQNIIKIYFKGFITKNISKKTDFEIKYISAGPMVISNQENTHLKYLNFYQEYDNRIVTFSHISLNQTSFILSKILNKLLIRNHGFIMHAAANILSDRVNIFTGKSSAGKSTILKYLSKKYVAFADDTIIIKRENNKYYCYQTPFIEKNIGINKTKKRFMINKIFFIKKAQMCESTQITNPEIIIELLSNQFIAEKNNINRQMNDLINFAKRGNTFYLLSFPKNSKKVIDFFDLL